MYKKTVKFEQGKSRLTLSDLCGGNWIDELSLEEKRDNIKAILKSKIKENELLPKFKKEEKLSLGIEINLLQIELNKLRPKLKGPRNLPEFFVEVARKNLTAFQFKRFIDEASKLAREAGTDGDENGMD